MSCEIFILRLHCISHVYLILVEANIVYMLMQAINYNGHNKLMENGKSVDERDEFKETFDVTMDLIGGIDKRPDSIYKDKSRDECVGPELGLSLKRSCSVSFENQDESKHQKLSLSDASAFSRYACFFA